MKRTSTSKVAAGANRGVGHHENLQVREVAADRGMRPPITDRFVKNQRKEAMYYRELEEAEALQKEEALGRIAALIKRYDIRPADLLAFFPIY